MDGALAVQLPAWLDRPAVSPSRSDLVSELFDAHYGALCRLATLLLDDPGTAEEAVQEAFLRTFVGWRRIREPERAHAYLRAAVVNQCRSRGRRRQSEQRGNAAVWSAEQAPRPDGDPAAAAVQRGEAVSVLAAVRSLPPRQRETVVLRYYADLAEADIAAALGCSVGTVKSQLSKARATLAARLVDHLPGADATEGAADG